MDDLVMPYVTEILRVQPTGPYMLAGYCMGGLVAIATATKYERKDGQESGGCN
jgi:thioesterase domain-containing protein